MTNEERIDFHYAAASREDEAANHAGSKASVRSHRVLAQLHRDEAEAIRRLARDVEDEDRAEDSLGVFFFDDRNARF